MRWALIVFFTVLISFPVTAQEVFEFEGDVYRAEVQGLEQGFEIEEFEGQIEDRPTYRSFNVSGGFQYAEVFFNIEDEWLETHGYHELKIGVVEDDVKEFRPRNVESSSVVINYPGTYHFVAEEDVIHGEAEINGRTVCSIFLDTRSDVDEEACEQSSLLDGISTQFLIIVLSVLFLIFSVLLIRIFAVKVLDRKISEFTDKVTSDYGGDLGSEDEEILNLLMVANKKASEEEYLQAFRNYRKAKNLFDNN